MAHGRDADPRKAAQIARVAGVASLTLDDDRSRLYCDLIRTSLSEAALQELDTMNPFKYEYQSDFAKRYVAEGRAEGRAAIVMRQLTLRFGPLSSEVQARIKQASIGELDSLGEHLLTAPTLQHALDRAHETVATGA
jgi:hypothetical protein